MDLVEPEMVFARRSGSGHTSSPLAHPAPHKETPRPFGDEFWTSAVFDTLRECRDEPMLLTSLVNAVAKLGKYTRRADYDLKRIELLRLVGTLIRTGRLDRVGRKHVVIPRTDARRQAYLAAATVPLDLPPPQV